MNRHTHFCTTGVCVCVCTFPLSVGPLPLQLHVIPLSLEEEECEDEGIAGGGGGIRVVSSYQHQGQLCKKKNPKKKPSLVHMSLCSV